MKKEIAKGMLEIGAIFLRPNEPFTWASGIKSPIYCDNRLSLSYPKLRTMIEQELAELIKKEFPECEILMGTSTAGIPHAAICGHLLDMPMGYVRAEAKTHGRNNKIEGKLLPGQKTVVIEDLISTGGSSIDVVNILREAGADVLGIVSIFSYGLKKGVQKLEEANVKAYSLLGLDDILESALSDGKITETQAENVRKFRENPESYAELIGIGG